MRAVEQRRMKILTPQPELNPALIADYNKWLENWMDTAGLEQTTNPTSRDYQCGACGCLFLTSADRTEIYLDRYQYADNSVDCDCHKLPRRIPIGSGTVIWYQQDMDLQWLCSAPLRSTARNHTCDKCESSPVAFLNLTAPTTAGPRWLCALHLGLPDSKVFAEWVPLESTSEPKEYRLAREAVETMLALRDAN
jgi:hypothetical protein